jgi:alkylation response protein AidB-like acyl-CoA dehydrogenase
MYEFLETFGSTISGGSNEIQRNLIAERGLGMPRG